MTDPFLGEIRAFGFGFAPRNWALCNGQVLTIQQNQALYSLIGVQYGGNGTTNFALPDLRGRTAVGAAESGPPTSLTRYPVGTQVGVPTVSLTAGQLPPHTHQMPVAAARTSSRAAGNADAPGGAYGAVGGGSTSAGLAPAGGGAAHQNLPPYLAVSFCIALVGIFPPRS